QILDRQRRVQPPRLRVEFRLLELQQFEDLGGFGKLPLYHCGLASSGREKCGHRSVVRSVATTLRERRQRRITSSLRVWSGSAPFAPMTEPLSYRSPPQGAKNSGMSMENTMFSSSGSV